MLRLFNKKAQSTAEYVIVLGLIIAAVIAMQTYIKRGFQGRIKEAVDHVDESGQAAGAVQFSGRQYEPYYLESEFDTTRNSQDREEMLTGGAVKRTLTQELSERHGHQTIGLGRASNE